MDFNFLFDRQIGELVCFGLGLFIGFKICDYMNSKSFKAQKELLEKTKDFEIQTLKKDFELKISTIQREIISLRMTEKFFDCDLVKEGTTQKIKAQYQNNVLIFNSCPFVKNGVCSKTSSACVVSATPL